MIIADLHCDLLAYLAEDSARTASCPDSRCSLPQLHQGNVHFQTMAVYTETGARSVELCQKQFEIFANLPELYPKQFTHLKERKVLLDPETVTIAAAIENASGLCLEEEPLDLCFSRFDQYLAHQILYISLTWNTENRFGGGNESTMGLKRDGELLLEYLSGKNIAIDLSHTSDFLAHDILEYIDKKNLDLTPIASHSNFRAVTDQKRNLPDVLAKEIFRRGGVIGLNFVRLFIGMTHSKDFIKHMMHAKELGGLEQYCFGADFFYANDYSNTLNHLLPFYFPKFQDASCYPELLAFLGLSFSKEELLGVAHKNIINFFERLK